MKLQNLPASILLVLLSFFMLQSCKDEEQLHPEVQTLPLIANSPSSVTLKGNVVARGTYNLVNYGFVYGYTSDIGETSGTKVVVGPDAPVGEYEKVITGLSVPSNYYYYDRNIYARAYITNEKGTVFGQVFSVRLPSPNVKGISPTSGKAGDKITITGDFYTSSAAEVEVTFASTNAKIVEVTPTKIVVEVPTGITYSYYYSGTQVPVALKMGNQSYTVTSSFKVNPTPKDFAPKSGTIGTVITVSGDNFPSYYSYSTLRAYIGQTEASISSYSSGSFQITVPSSVTSDKLAISVVADGVTTILPGEFTVTPHTVTSISPASGLPGSTFNVYGSFNGANSYYSTNASVKIGDTPATVSYVSSGQLTVAVPQGVTVGSHKVKVTLGPHTVEAPQQFEVLAPSVTTFSPTSAGIGREVTINGTFVPGQYYNVYFGATYASGYSTSATTLRVNVPSGVDTGKVPLSVQFGTQRIYATDDFTILAPTISSFSPTSAVPGTVVTINVSGFTPNYYTAVRFGTVTTPVVSYTESTIRAAVPSGVTGAMKISVVHGGQTIVSTDNFTVN